MTNEQANCLIAIVKRVLAPKIAGHPEREDMIGEAILRAYQAVERMPADSPYSWTTITARAAQWGAWEYLRQRCSGRLNLRRDGEAIRPLFLDELDFAERDGTLQSDGGIAAADARLQLWVWERPRHRPCAVCRRPIDEDRRSDTRYCSTRCYRRAKERRRGPRDRRQKRQR